MDTWPEWFKLAFPGLPDCDAAGHQLGPGLISQSFVTCKPCPATTDGRGHHVWFCRENGCRASETRPPGCSGAYGPTRDVLWERAVKAAKAARREPGG